MNLQNSHSKKYVLTFFMSICLLTSSFLSTSARAASFKDLVSKTPTWEKHDLKQQQNIWKDFTPNEKIKKWQEANLVPSFTQAQNDLGIKYKETDLSSFLDNTRYKARQARAEILLYIERAKQQNFDTKKQEYINQGVAPTDIEAATNLGISYDPSKIDNNVEKDQKVRRAEKDKKAVIDLYISSINRDIKYKHYVDNNIIPEMKEVKTALNMGKDDAESFIVSIRTEIMENAKRQYIADNHIPTEKELKNRFGISRDDNRNGYIKSIRLKVMDKEKPQYIAANSIPTEKELEQKFGADKGEATNYIASIATQKMLNKKAFYIDKNIIPTIEELKEEFKIGTIKANSYIQQITAGINANQLLNNNDTTKPSVGGSQKKSGTKSDNWYMSNQGTNTTGTSSRVPTGRKEKQPYSFDPISTFKTYFNTKESKGNLTQSQHNINRIIQQEENIEEFENLIKTDPIAALNLKVDSSYKKEAVTTILSDFNDDTIQRVLFSNDRGQLDFNTNIDVKNRPILKELLENSSSEEKTKFAERIKDYATRNISNSQFKEKARLDLIKLAASKDKSSVEKFLALQLELKNKMQSHIVKSEYILTPEIVAEINIELKNKGLIIDSLTKDDMIKLAKEVNKQTLNSVIKVILSDNNALSNETNKILGLAVGNNTNNLEQTQSGIPNPLPLPLNGGIPNPPPLPLNVSMPPPPPPLNSQGFISNSNNFDLNKLQAEYPHIHSLYIQFTRNTTVQPKVPLQPTASSATSTERSEPETAYAKLYVEYRAETNLDIKTKKTSEKANDLQSQIIKRKDDITNVIRQILTESYANQGADKKTLINLFSIATPEIEEKAKEIFKELVQDPYMQGIIVNGKKATTSEDIIKNLFNEDPDDAAVRIVLSSCKISEDIKKPIKHELNQLKLIKEIDNESTPFKQLEAAYKKTSMLDQDIFANRVEELINNPNILTIAQQTTFLITEDTNLRKTINSDQAQAKLDDLRTAILSTIKFEELITANLPKNEFIAIVKEKEPELLKEFLKATTIKLEGNNNLDQLRLVLPSFTGMSNEQVRILSSKLNMTTILKALKEYSQEKAKKHIHTGNMPPPPPPASKDSELAYLTSLGITKDWISRITKLNANTSTSTFKTTPKIYNFSSDIAVRYKEFALSGQKSAGHKAKYSDADLFKKAIVESVAFEHSKNLSKVHQNNKYFAKIQEAVDTMHSSFIGPRTEIGQKIHNIYTSKLLELTKDKEFIKYVEDDIILSKKLTEAFTSADSDSIDPRTGIRQEVHNIYTQQLTKYPEEAVKEAFNTANSDFIGPRTEIGQEVHNIYKSKLLELAKDKELFLFVEQLLAESTELEQKYGSDVQPENSNNEKKVGRLDMKQFQSLFQQGNEATNDESSTKDDTQPEDSNKKSEKSDSETALSPRLLSSNDSKNDKSSDNKKSLLALRSSDEEDKGYETEEELEESNNTTEEESKKDIALESEDEAIDVSFKTEAIAEQDKATQRQQVYAETNNKVAVLEVVDRTISVTNKHIYSNIFNNRLDIAPIVAAGDEEASINRGVWISGLYGINKQGTWKNIPKYQGRTTGVTIGADTEFINSHDVIGIAYSRLESQIKYNKKLGKTAVNGHLLSIYGLKELIKGFSLQAITSYGHNYIKNKSKNINNIIGKYQNNNLSFQTLLNYKYRTKYDLHFIPNIGFKYDYSRASNYKEYNVDIENLIIQKKSNQSVESSIGSKIVFKPIATVNNIVLTPSLYGNIERHFNNKNTKVNAKATFKGQTLQETIIIPKQPKLGYNVGSNILMSRKNINVLLEYNYYTHRKYQSHQGLIKLKVNL
ncbi:autotransporter outer membrane beta-barrel domain-containing protein [Rickettsia hoogstraalii]|uniref:autotransporter outer membrane beta-barrel domain-containing protein n=1 Tax=Rickettsia hoogstraalii TaxID=467174 RepID=UPI0022535EC8|nr:autotransporter outer membrane beta-barrel domain-containing protein [Rickettsia hoogstraalii]MCX4084503.1 autotransporter outer membrane beta-barrel domain-containing protein [Rickettsia hoogstraalii]